MGTYAIGDLQGCYVELLELLNEINFDETNDRLWFVGDIVNRGPMSLECLEFVMSLGDNARTVLGNHDLHLLAVAQGIRKDHRKDTLQEIIEAEHAHQLLHWVRQQPVFVTDDELGFSMVHAGLPPQWSLQEVAEHAAETEELLRSKDFYEFMQYMYGDSPDQWTNQLSGHDRYRFMINVFTRCRYIDTEGRLNIQEKGAPGTQPEPLIPWYAHPERLTRNDNIIFGHWSTVTLGNETDFQRFNVYPLDTGCLWGGKLTAMRLEDKQLFSVPSRQPKISK
ncbi:MAG: symmetrical bis(5'-nucleosyl)-tetraphosphatase [Gammaproteobacteria bacterium]